GLLVTQFHESPPSAPGTAPVGKASSTQGTSLEIPVGARDKRRRSTCAFVEGLARSISGRRRCCTGLIRRSNMRPPAEFVPTDEVLASGYSVAGALGTARPTGAPGLSAGLERTIGATMTASGSL